MQADAAGRAGDAATNASRDAINAQVAMYNQSRADTLPYQVTGTGALNLLAQMYGLPTYSAPISGGIQITQPEPASLQFSTGGGTGNALAGGGTLNQGTGTPDFSMFYQTPDYLVARDEGINALDRGASARGGLYSGGADADRMTFASNLGSKAFGNFQNNLFRLSGLGSNANSELNSLGQNTAGQIGNQLANAGNARASSFLNQGQAWNNALAGVGGAIGDYWSTRRG
ncbi:TPA: hypothetical protein ACOEOO_000107 [Stenotrophomonas maltophilia]